MKRNFLQLSIAALSLLSLTNCNREDVSPAGTAMTANQKSDAVAPQCRMCINYAGFRIDSPAPYLQGRNVTIYYWNSPNGDDVIVLRGGNGYTHILDDESGLGRIGMDNWIPLRIPTEVPNGTYAIYAYSKSEPNKQSPTASLVLSGGNYKDQNFVISPSKNTYAQTFVTRAEPIYIEWDSNAINSGQGYVTIAVREESTAGTIWRPGCYAKNLQYSGGYANTYAIPTKYIFPNNGQATITLNSVAAPSIFPNGTNLEFIVSDADNLAYGLSGKVTIQD